MKGMVRGRQCWSMLLLFLCGWALTMQTNSRDSWIAILIAAGIGLLLTALYWIPSEQLRGESYYALLRTVYGQTAGRVLCVLLSIAAFWGLCMSSLSFVVFLRTVSDNLWPIWLIAALLLLVAAVTAEGGSARMALWSEPVVWIVLAALVLSLVLTLADADWTQLMPVLADGWDGIKLPTYEAVSVPFAECWFVAAVLAGNSVRARQASLTAVVTAGVLLAVTALRNVAVLGQAGAAHMWYPTFTAAGLIEIGKSFQRGEVLVSGSLLLCGVARAAVFLCFVADGLSESFAKCQRRPTVWVAAIAAGAICLTVGGTLDFRGAEWLYRIILFPVLLVFAVVTAVCAMWRKRKLETQQQEN